MTLPADNAQKGIADDGNSTVTPLSGGATFTGDAVRTPDADVMVSCQADADGTLYFDFSNDNSNWSTFPPVGFTVSSGIHEFHTAVKGPRWFRVRLVNGSGAQSYLRLYTYFGTYRQGNLPINATIGSDADAIVVRSVDATLDLALGRFGGMVEDTKFGYVKAIDAADDPADIWDWGSDDISGAKTKTFPTSAATLYIASDAAGDTSKVFTVYYIDANGADASVEVTTNASDGTTPVSLGVTGLDVYRVVLTGDTQTHAGNIYVQQGSGFSSGVPTSAAAVLAFVRAGHGQTQQTQFTVPAGKILRMKRVIVTVARASGAAGSAEIQLLAKPSGGSWAIKREWFLQTGVLSKPVAGLVFSAGTQLTMRVDDVSDTDTNVTGEYAFDLVDA